MATLGRRLYDQGWRQGSIIPHVVSQPVYTGLQSAMLESVSLDDCGALVLATQDCDLVKSDDKLPHLEAIGCIEDASLARKVRPNDGRYFVLDRRRGLVADRSVSIALTREALAQVVPPPEVPFEGNDRAARRFARWLGMRSHRPAIPDGAVDAIQKPLARAVERLTKPGGALEYLNDGVHEIRVAGALDGSPPYVVALIFVLTHDAEIARLRLGIAELLHAAGFAIEEIDTPGEDVRAVIVREWVALPPASLSVEAYHGSTPLSLDSYSWRGDETVGAEQLDSESS